MKKLLLFLIAATLQASTYCVGSSYPAGLTCDHTYALNALQTAVDAVAAANDGTVIITAGQTTTGGTIVKPRALTGRKLINIISSELLLISGRPSPGNPHLAIIDGGLSTTCDITGATAPSWVRYAGIQFIGPPSFYLFLDFGCRDPGSNDDIGRPAYWPHHYFLDKIVIDIPTTVRLRNAITISGAHIHITNSYLNGAHSSSEIADPINGSADESHEISGVNLGGPIYVENNYITCETICTLFGGSVPIQRGVGATDIFLRGNRYIYPWRYMFRFVLVNPTTGCNVDDDGIGEKRKNTVLVTYWECRGTPGYRTGTWFSITSMEWDDAVYSLGFQKNKAECKSCQRGVIEGNLIEGGSDVNLRDNQNANALLFNQVDGVCEAVDGSGYCLDDIWATIRDIRFQFNLIRNTNQVISQGSLAHAPTVATFPDNYGYVSRQAGNVFSGNLAYNIGPPYLAAVNNTGVDARGRLFNLARTGDKGFGASSQFTHNTFLAASDAEGYAVNLEQNLYGRQVVTGNIFSYFGFGWYNAGMYWTAITVPWPASSGKEFSHNVLPTSVCVGPQAPNTCVFTNVLVNGDGGEDPGKANYFTGYTPTTWYDLATVALDSTTDPTQMKLSSGSPFKNWDLFGADAGADVTAVTRATANAISGTGLPTFLNTHVKSVIPGTGQIAVTYLCPNGSAGTLKFKKNKDFSAGTTDQADSSTSLLMRSTTATLTAGAWFGQLSCGSDVKPIQDQNGTERFVIQ